MDTGARRDKLVKAAHQTAAAGHDDAVVGNIGDQLGRGLFEHQVDFLHDALDGLFKGLEHFGGGNGDQLRQPRNEASALDLHGHFLLGRENAADLHLHLLGRALADEQVVLAAHILDDGLVELVARDLDGGRLDDAGEGDDRDVGRTAADVDDHVALGLGDVDARADGGGDRLFNEVDAARAGLNARVDDRALLDLGDAGWNADDDARLEELEADDLVQKLLDHALSDLVIGDHALAQGANGDDVAGGAAEHGLRVRADLQELAGILVERNDRGFVEHNAFILNVDQHRRGAKIHADILGERKHSLLPLIF